MFNSVLKVKLEPIHKQSVTLSGERVTLLAVGQEAGGMVLWYESSGFVDTAQGTPVTVYIAQTDQTYEDIADSVYVGTVQMENGDVRHIYASGAPSKNSW